MCPRNWRQAVLVLSLATALTLPGVVVARAAEKGLVAYYSFDKVAGSVVSDESGNGNNGEINGGVKQVTGSFGSALQFDGKNGFVDCGLGVDITAKGTVMIWVYPQEAVQGGLVSWVIDDSYEGARLMFTVDTWHGGAGTSVIFSDGKKFEGFSGSGNVLGTLPKNAWTHLAYTFDGKTFNFYCDGVLVGTQPQKVRPVTDKVPLWIGKSMGLGKYYFSGMLDEVRIYNRPLSDLEIRANYKEEGKRRGKDMSIFSRVLIEPHAYPGPGKITAALDAQGMFPLPGKSALVAGIYRPGTSAPIQKKETRGIYPVGPTEVIFDVGDLAAGDYEIRSWVIGPDGKQVGETSTVPIKRPGRLAAFKNIKILNNFCWELVNISDSAVLRTVVNQPFTLPYDRWVFIRTTVQAGDGDGLSVVLDAATPVISHSESGETTLETMRYLKAGEHILAISRKGKGELKSLVVRAIPELQHAFYGADPWVQPYGPYDWEFLKKSVLPNINTMVAGLEHYRRADAYQRLKEWTDTGRRWMEYKAIPWNEASGEAVFNYFANTIGMQNPLVNGIVLDEANGGDLEVYDYFRGGVEKITADPKFAGKPIHVYCDMLTAGDRSTRFAQACLKSGGYLCWEQYFSEVASAVEARQAMYRSMVRRMPLWEEVFPGCTRRMVMVLCYMSAPVESCNRRPDVNFKVFMEMQMNLLANHPAFFGLGGLQEYHSGYSDEENVRWAARLYRHYAIEGNTTLLNEDPYNLSHVRNPDFSEGLRGWEIQPAEADTIQVKRYERYGRLQGRWPESRDGDTFLWMKRSAKQPNVFGQTITGLTPGRLYSMKMITSDYQDLLQEKSEKKGNSLSVTIDNAELLTGPDKSFQYPLPNADSQGKFTGDYKYYINYNWRVFRAKETSAKLTITDWESDKEPGGPIGQELMFNFIEIQPYLE